MRGDAGEGVCRKQVENRQILGGEHTVKAFKAERTPSGEEVGNMRLLEIGSSGQGGAGEEAAFDAAEDFQAKVLMKGIKLHVWTIAIR